MKGKHILTGPKNLNKNQHIEAVYSCEWNTIFLVTDIIGTTGSVYDSHYLMTNGKPDVSTLFEAISNNAADVEVIKDILIEHADYGKLKNIDGRTALHIACSLNKKELVEVLLPCSDPLSSDEAGWTPLHTVAASGYDELLTLLIKSIKSLDPKTSSGGTPLHYAASKGRNVLPNQILATAGADINLTDANGHTPLGKAVCNNQTDIVEYLIKKGANFFMRERITEDNLLHIAVNNKNSDISAMVFKNAPQLARQKNKEGKDPADLASTADLLAWKAIQEGTYESFL